MKSVLNIAPARHSSGPVLTIALSCALCSPLWAGTANVKWTPLNGIESAPAGFKTIAADPAMMSAPFARPVARTESCLLIEMRASQAARVQLFWMLGNEAVSEQRSVHFDVPATQGFATYAVDLAANGTFQGLDRCRLDPGDGPGLKFEIRSLKCVAPSQVPPDLLAGLIRFRCYTSKLHYLPGERIEFRAALTARSYPERQSSKILKLELCDEAGQVHATSSHQYGLRPGSQFKEVQGDFQLTAPLKPGKYTLKAESFDQKSGLRLSSEHAFGIQGPDDPVVVETPFKFVKDFCIIQDRHKLWHVFSITGDFFDNHDWMPDGQERTFSHSTSTDLIHWTMHPPVISISDDLHPDGRGRYKDRNVWAPHVIEHAGRYWMFYTSVNQQVSQSISLATSTDLYKWVEFERNPVFTPEGVEGINWARDRWGDCRDPMVLKDGDKFYLYATVNVTPPGETGGIVVAQSTDLMHWTNPQIAVRGKVISESPQVFRIGNKYCMTTSSIGAATYVSDHPVHGWKRADFPRPAITTLERYVATSGSYAEEVVQMLDGTYLMASLTWRHWGNSIYLFRMNTADDMPSSYQAP